MHAHSYSHITTTDTHAHTACTCLLFRFSSIDRPKPEIFGPWPHFLLCSTWKKKATPENYSCAHSNGHFPPKIIRTRDKEWPKAHNKLHTTILWSKVSLVLIHLHGFSILLTHWFQNVSYYKLEQCLVSCFKQAQGSLSLDCFWTPPADTKVKHNLQNLLSKADCTDKHDRTDDKNIIYFKRRAP